MGCADIWKVEPPFDVFLIGGVGMTIVSVIGILGNVLTILVLTRPVMKSSTTIILLGLSVCDLIYVTTICIRTGFRELFTYLTIWREYITTVYPVIHPFSFPIADISSLGSVYFTVAVTVERFIVVSFPLRARSYCTVKNAVRTSIIIVALAVLLRLPSWFGLSYEDRYVNGTWVCYQITTSEFRRSSIFRLYYHNWAGNFVYRIIPLTVLCVLNWKIYKKVREANLSRQTMMQSERNEISITKMLLVVVLVFMVCFSVRFVNRLIQAILGGEYHTPRIYIMLENLLVNLNSAVNFIIYCLMGEKFRRTCIHFLCPRSMRGTNTDGSTISTSIRNSIPFTMTNENSNQRELSSDSDSISLSTTTTATTQFAI